MKIQQTDVHMAFGVPCILAMQQETKISSGKTVVTSYMNKYKNKSRFKNMNHCQPRQEKKYPEI